MGSFQFLIFPALIGAHLQCKNWNCFILVSLERAVEAHISEEAAETLSCLAWRGQGVSRGQNDVVQSTKIPQRDVLAPPFVQNVVLYFAT